MRISSRVKLHDKRIAHCLQALIYSYYIIILNPFDFLSFHAKVSKTYGWNLHCSDWEITVASKSAFRMLTHQCS